MRFELWHCSDGRTETYTLLPGGASLNDAALEPNAKVIWTVEADTWEEACRKQYEFLGWEPYKPMHET